MAKMTRDEALELLLRGQDGVAEWNRQREAGAEIPRLAVPSPDKTDLSGADLRGVNLSESILPEAIFADANLTGANLYNADLSSAILTRANLSGANLGAARLRGARLDEANLSEAVLAAADLRKANIRGANLLGAVFGVTMLTDVDLSTVDSEHLRSIRHEFPSYIDTRTLANSHGRIPVQFLRGCGLSDWEVEAARLYDLELSPGQVADIQQRVFDLRAGAVIQLYSVFISHSHANKAFAKALHDALQAEGVRCWLDEKQIKPGDDLQDAIAHGIKHWDKLILCCSEAALERSWWVEDEIDRTLDKERELRKHHGAEERLIIPIDLDGHVFNWSNSRAKILTRRKVADFSDWKPGAQLPEERLLELLEALQVGRGKGEPKSFLPDLP